MDVSNSPVEHDRATAAACSLKQLFRMTRRPRREHVRERVPQTCTKRLCASLVEPRDAHSDKATVKQETVLYLAYGSNLSNETFRGNRGIKPISQINVQVPSLRLTFDLPGLPYAEPCFANSGRRDPSNDPPKETYAQHTLSEKTPLLGDKEGYHKNHWHKGLIGVVYEVTLQDYAHIIATEGGGSSYHDILVDCHPFSTSDPTAPVPQNPTFPAFKAHTLFAPAAAPGEDPPKDGGRFQRPDISYAQPSARYLKLISDGAAELGLPNEYREYLQAIRPYTITTNKQRLGQFIFLAIWGPIIAFIFSMGRMFQDEDGTLPQWMRELFGAIFKGVWASYDSFFASIFGDGERTITDGGHDCGDEEIAQRTGQRFIGGLSCDRREVDVEKGRVLDHAGYVG